MYHENNQAAAVALAPVGTDTPGLRQNYLRLPELISQSIGLVGVSGGIGILIPAVFATAGNGTWLAYLFATVALLFSSWSISWFARGTASPGALYTYVSHGIGPIWGVICGWSLLVAYAVGAAGILQGTVNTFVVLAQEIGLLGSGNSLPANVLLTVVIALAAWYIAFRGMRLSTRFTLLVELLTILLIAVVIIAFIASSPQKIDHPQLSLQGVNPSQLRLGMVLAFFSFTGFESATVLGAEARDPLKSIPRAVVISIVGPAFLFILASYGLVSAFHGQHPTLDQANGPLSILAHSVGLGGFGVIIDAGVALSFFAAFFSSINAAARIIYTFARQGLVHSASGRAHSSTATPHIAVNFLVIFSLVLGLIFTFNKTALLDSYGYLSTIATYGYLLAYALVAIGAPIYLKRQGKLDAGKLLVSILSVVLLAIPLIGSVYPLPPGVYAWLPYVFIALVAAGLLWFLALKLFKPERLQLIETVLSQD